MDIEYITKCLDIFVTRIRRRHGRRLLHLL